MQVHSEYIDKAITKLSALRDRKLSTSCKSTEDELDSYCDARDMVKDAHLVFADLMIALCEIASEAAGKSITETDRRNFRDRHLIDDALFEADEWAEELRERLSVPAEYSTINVSQQGLVCPVARA